jgi:phosphoribosylformylglycinamidine (FGAM) synthase-like amidotransferase family enzyme
MHIDLTGYGRQQLLKTNEEIIDYLKRDILDLMIQQNELDINDSFSDYIIGVIDRSQSVLRMMGVPENEIPNDGSC